MLLVDSLIRLLSLASLDVTLPSNWPAEFLPVHAAAGAPCRTCPDPNGPMPDASAESILGPACDCERYTLQRQWPSVLTIAPKWQSSMMWPHALSEGEMRKEEGRRIVWASIMISSASTHYDMDSGDFDPTDLSIHDSQKVCLELIRVS